VSVKSKTDREPLTYSVPEVAELLGISRGHAFALAAKDKLPGAVKLGGRTVVSRRAIDRLLDGSETEKEGAP
jgi:excisionase family DNA binding protein